MIALDALPAWAMIAAVYGLASAVTFVAYGLDKARAKNGQRRIPEATLHTLELCCGWPGALLGMQVFRHKTAKTAFRLVTYTIAGLHVAAWAMLLSRAAVAEGW